MNNRNNEEEEEKEENAVIRILQSSTCRRLFSWGGSPGAAVPCEVSEEARREQRLRWNFDFQTETPLPGRYQWVRTVPLEDSENRNGGAADRAPCAGAPTGKRRTPPCETQLRLPEKRRMEDREATGSCDRSLNDPQNSDERSLDDPPSYHVDLT